MGEKPLSIDESPVHARTIGGAEPSGGVDTPPPDMSGAAGIITTRSNIKHSGSAVASPTDGGGGGVDGVPDDAPSPGAGAAGINTTRSNIKNASVADGASGSQGNDTEGQAGIAIKEQGIKYGGGTDAQETSAAGTGPVKPTPTNPPDPFPDDPRPGGSAGGMAEDGEPIPGLDVKLGKNAGGAASIGPPTSTPTNPPDPFPDAGGQAGYAIREQGIKYGEAGDA